MEVVQIILQERISERISERIVEQIVDGPVPQILNGDRRDGEFNDCNSGPSSNR